MAQRFEISIHSPRRDATGQPALGRPTSRIKALLQGFAALLVVSAVAAVGIAIGTAVAVVIASLVAIALAALLVRGALDRIKAPDRSWAEDSASRDSSSPTPTPRSTSHRR